MNGPEREGRVFVVAAGEAGRRLDVLLRERCPERSRAAWKEEIAAGRVLRNGRPARKGDPVREGDEIRIEPPAPAPAVAADPEGTLVVLYEDGAAFAVEKEAGLPTLPASRSDRRALACRVAARWPETAGVGRSLEAGLVHRLDEGTSGAVVGAKNETAYVLLRDQWRRREVRKEYVVLVEGRVERSFRADAPVGHHPRSARRMVAGAPEGRPAETRFEPLHAGPDRTLLLAGLREGRRHQIRVHLAHAGLPVAGDPLYGRGGGGRMMLHACRVRFRSPAGPEADVFSPPPEDFRSRLLADAGKEALRALDSLPEILGGGR